MSANNSAERNTDRLNDGAPEAEFTVGKYTVIATVTQSAGKDGAFVVFVDTNFEPNEPTPGLRILLNDSDLFVGKPYEANDDDEAGR